MQKKLSNTIDQLLDSEIDIAIRGRVRALLGNLDIQEGDKILDAGCGWGYYLKLISKLPHRDYHLFGIDLDKSSVNIARKSLSNAKIKVLEGDLEKLKFKSNYFDKIILSEVAEHLPYPEIVFKELFRVLKPGGLLLVTVPNHNYPIWWDPVNWILEHTSGKHVSKGFCAGIWTNHLRLYTPQQISKSLKESGFKIGKCQSISLFSLPFNKNLLYGGKLPKNVSRKFIKQIKSSKRPFYLQMLIYFVSLNDKLNQMFMLKNIGISVFVKAIK